MDMFSVTLKLAYLLLQILFIFTPGHLKPFTDENVCEFHKNPTDLEIKFTWRNVENNFTHANRTQVSDLWNEKCLYGATYNRVKMVNNSLITAVDFQSNSNQTTKTFFCNLENLFELTWREDGPKELLHVGLNLTSNCVMSSCGQNLIYLNLNDNIFKSLKNHSFCSLIRLQELYLDDCQIQSIESMAFANLKNIEIISMAKNKLDLLNPRVFNENLKLKKLYISLNNIISYSLEALKPLTSLTHLYFDGNKIENLKILQHFNLTEISVVDFSSNFLTSYNNEFKFQKKSCKLILDNNLLNNFQFQSVIETDLINLSNNKLQSVPKFNNVLKVNNFYLSNNLITSINNSHFQNFSNINRLMLDENLISHISQDAFQSVEINVLSLSKNQISDLNQTFKISTVKHLFLDFNYLTELVFDEFSPYLKSLSLKNNKIQQVIAINSNFKNWTLETLDLSYNHLTNIKFSFPNSVMFLSVMGNKINYFSFEEFYTKFSHGNLKEVMLQNNKIDIIYPYYAFSDYSYNTELRIIKLGAKILLGGNILKCNCENAWLLKYRDQVSESIWHLNEMKCSQTFKTETKAVIKSLASFSEYNLFCESNYTNSNRCQNYHTDDDFMCTYLCPVPCTCYTVDTFVIAHIYCSSQNLTTLPAILEENLKSTLHLYLDGNYFKIIKSDNFINYRTMSYLYLNHSNICEIEESAFQSLEEVETLHLDYNQISNLPENIFQNLTKLIQLYLSNNFISKLTPQHFQSLKQLNELYLDNNHLTIYNAWELNSLYRLTLHDNPWSCECEFVLKIQPFLQYRKTYIPNVQDVNCYENNLNMSLLTYNNSHCYSTITGLSTLMTIVGVAVPFTSVALISVLMFVYRKELQVLLYYHYKIRLFGRRNNSEGKYYDAFVAYNSADLDYVVKHLVPNLEEIEDPYRLCLHQRDFLAGPPIQSNITQAVDESCNTIVLLTKKFYESNWCLFEFKTAHAQMLSDRHHRVIVVVIGGNPFGTDKELNLYLKTNTYLIWDEPMFWKKLCFALSENRIADYRSPSLILHFVDGSAIA